MMKVTNNGWATRVQVAAHISIILVSLIGAIVLVKNHLLRPAAERATEAKPATPNGAREASAYVPPKPPPAIAEGTRLTVDGVEWGSTTKTVVLALSSKCQFCTESAGFYQRLATALNDRKDVRLIAVFPQDVTEGKKYLDEIKVPVAEVKQAFLSTMGVRGTPTLIIVNSSGVVEQSWVGRLSAEKETEVLNHI
jgi:hypothetical protein